MLNLNELFVITTYFNPCGYKNRLENYHLFMAGMNKAGVNCITIECVFEDQDFELPESIDVIRIRAKSLLWQKERLLNLAASWLPSSCKYVAWLDCDILFENKNWARDLIKVLESHKVAQVFETAYRQTANQSAQLKVSGKLSDVKFNEIDDHDVAESFAYVMRERPESLHHGRYDMHGHTGYGWAMRKEIFDEVGLYEHAISGCADHFMAHAIFNNCNHCIMNALKGNLPHVGHLKEWMNKFHAMVGGSLGVVPGQIQHIYHGDAVNRQYFSRLRRITELGYNPWTDIEIVPGQPLSWTSDFKKHELASFFRDYFLSRKEDGIAV